jgi:electron transfer flavoprotein alpha subunit
VNWGINHD